MKKSLLIIAIGFGAGYLLGARAGRERYDLIVEKANSLWEDPRVARARREAARYAREQAPVIRDKAQAAAKAAPGVISDGAKATAAAAKDVADRTVATARDLADRTTTTARDLADRTTATARDLADRTTATVAAKAGEARDAVLEDDDEQ
jgi:hypothetical protein